MTLDTLPKKTQLFDPSSSIFLDSKKEKDHSLNVSQEEALAKANMYKNILNMQPKYFTWWVIFLLFFPQSHKVFNMLFLTTFVFVTSTIIFFIRPAFVIVPYLQEVVTLKNKFVRFVVHIIIHVLPFIYVVFFHGNKYVNANKKIWNEDERLINALLLFVLYVVSMNIQKIYFIDWKDILISTILSFASYLLLKLLL